MMDDLRQSTTVLLGFLTIAPTIDGNGYLGALMVTNEQGHPLEFRATTPVKPTPFQKVLYGAGLEHFIGIERCAKELLRTAQRKPELLLVDQRELLGAGTEFPRCVMWVRRAGERPDISQSDTGIISISGRLEGAVGGFQPVVYEGTFQSDDQREQAVAILEDCFAHFDLTEAFSRMRAALELLANNDPRYR